ncbi:hypothetical protein KJ765_03025 [Candidatus Micrarchaeota archaeon]|nr:hypothetical protein [Candidatus Micrarchaeota archaeon]
MKPKYEEHAHEEQKTFARHRENEVVFDMRVAHYALIVFIALVLAFNQYTINNINVQSVGVSGSIATLSAKLASAPSRSIENTEKTVQVADTTTQPITTAGELDLNALVAQVIPTGVPNKYGSELGVSFDDPVNSMNIMAKLDDGNALPNAEDNERYARIGLQISCEYCCGAQSILFPTGKAACGCAHSFAMRGLLKYLVTEHPEMSDDEMLEEIGAWKTIYFPRDSVKKAVLLVENGVDLNYVNLQSNKYRGGKGLTAGSGASVELPGQVGGC